MSTVHDWLTKSPDQMKPLASFVDWLLDVDVEMARRVRIAEQQRRVAMQDASYIEWPTVEQALTEFAQKQYEQPPRLPLVESRRAA